MSSYIGRKFACGLAYVLVMGSVMRIVLGTAAMLLLVVGGLLCMGRRSRPSRGERSAIAAPVEAPKAAVPVTAATPRTKRYEASLAGFRNDALEECVDLSVDIELAPESDAGWPKEDPTKNYAAAMAKSPGKGRQITILEERCAAQFADRSALATCTIRNGTSDAGISTETQLLASYYGFASVGLDDNSMRDCFSAKGKWAAIPRDSDEWRRAKLEHSSNAARRLLR
jgi:hypothetical protein